MINDTALGLIVAAVPLLIIGFLALRRLPAVFAFFVVLLAVGLGYLQTTGAVRDFGHKVRATLPAGMLPAGTNRRRRAMRARRQRRPTRPRWHRPNLRRPQRRLPQSPRPLRLDPPAPRTSPAPAAPAPANP